MRHIGTRLLALLIRLQSRMDLAHMPESKPGMPLWLPIMALRRYSAIQHPGMKRGW